MPSDAAQRPARGVERRFACRLRKTRAEIGVSRALFAELVGLPVGELASLEEGDSSPSLSTMARIADALGIEVVEMIGTGSAPFAWDSPEHRMEALCRSFPSLRGVQGVHPFQVDVLEEFTLDPAASLPAIAAARFALSLWMGTALEWSFSGPMQSFDIVDAMGRWDVVHRSAFANWATAPWSPAWGR